MSERFDSPGLHDDGHVVRIDVGGVAGAGRELSRVAVQAAEPRRWLLEDGPGVKTCRIFRLGRGDVLEYRRFELIGRRAACLSTPFEHEVSHRRGARVPN